MHREIGGDDYDGNALHGGANGVRKTNLLTIIILFTTIFQYGKKNTINKTYKISRSSTQPKCDRIAKYNVHFCRIVVTHVTRAYTVLKTVTGERVAQKKNRVLHWRVCACAYVCIGCVCRGCEACVCVAIFQTNGLGGGGDRHVVVRFGGSAECLCSVE